MPAAVRPEDVAFNRVSVALARSQSLVASWLPAPSTGAAAAQKTPEQLQQEESALFTPGSDMYAIPMHPACCSQKCLTFASLGVGAEPPKDILDGSFKRTQLSSNERLRQQILGKHAAAKGRGAQSTDKAAHLPTKKLDRQTRPSRAHEASDDEGDGRAAMFKSKRKMAPAPVKKTSAEDDTGSEDEVKGNAELKQAAPAESVSPVQEKPRKRPMSFLDEMLEERSKKQKKKQKAQVEALGKAEKEVPSPKEKEAKASEGKARMDDSEGLNGKATLKEASQKHEEAEKPDTSADVPMADGAEKKKKKNKKRKKNKEEASEQT